jgi:hypothetical protein
LLVSHGYTTTIQVTGEQGFRFFLQNQTIYLNVALQSILHFGLQLLRLDFLLYTSTGEFEHFELQGKQFKKQKKPLAEIQVLQWQPP